MRLKGFIITDKSNNVRDYTEDEIVIHKEGIDFSTEELGYFLNKKSNFSFTITFIFIIIWSFLSETEVLKQSHQFFYLAI